MSANSSQPSASESTSSEVSVLGYLAVALAWAVPGLGHFMLGKWSRGIVFALTIHGLFGAGLLLGGVRAINPPDQPIWTYTQFLTGWPMLIANRAQKEQQVTIDELNRRLHDQEMGRPEPDAPQAEHQAFGKSLIAKYPIFAYHPKIQDIGSVYCGIAGMLNLLVIFDVLLRATRTPRAVAGGNQPLEAASAGGQA